MPKVRMCKVFVGRPQTARQLIRHRNIMLGLPMRHLTCALIPFGFELDPDREGYLRPIDRDLRLLYKARELKQRSSLKDVAAWLSKEASRTITPDSLAKIFRLRPPLQAYQLSLDERLRIATAETEDEAINLCSEERFGRKKGSGGRKDFYKLRSEAVKRAEEARGIKETPANKEE